MSYFSEHRRGFVGTIVVHGIVLILLLLFGFFTQLPLPGEEGILVNFGNSSQGSGPKEPAPSKKTPPPVVREEKKQTPAPAVAPPKPAPTVPQPAAKEEVMTQDFEKTVAIESAKKKKEEELKRKLELEQKQKIEELRKKEDIKRQADLKVQREAEIERQRLAEIESQKQAAEAERVRKAEEERKRVEAEQQKISEINSRATNAFGSGGAGDNSSKSTGEGVSFPGGNQGSPNGSANSTNYDNGGGEGNGPSFSLAGRSALSMPKPYYPGNEEGIIVVQVKVDKNGKVTSADPGVRGSNTYNTQLLSAAKQAALKARFNVDEKAPAFQQGTITYRFILD